MIDLGSLPLDKWSDEDLAGMLDERDAAMKKMGDERRRIAAELLSRYGEKLRTAYAAKSKDHGKVEIDADGFTLSSEIRQSVEWDQAMLREVGDKVTAEEAAHVIQVELSVSERVFNALPPGDLKKSLEAARTTKLSAPSLKVRFDKEE